MSDRAPVISLERVLPAPPDRVFRALTEADLFARWMGPEGSSVVVEEMSVSVGGRLAFRVALPDGGPEFRLHGEYQEIVPPSRLVHSWAMEGEEGSTTVVFELEPSAEGTRLRLIHQGLTAEEMAQNEAGWQHQLDRLETLVGR